MPTRESAEMPPPNAAASQPTSEFGSPEGRERHAARSRAVARERERAAGQGVARDPYTGLARAGVAARAFAALAENVRDYAIFLMDPDGIITFWGEGARLIKWWTKDEAEGAHLRLLYPDGGSDDGTAEEHLRAAVERGEYTGEGERMRSDGSTFWAGVTLTPLWDDEGALLGFAKVTRDLTARRAADALLQAAAESADEARRAAEQTSQAKTGFLATMSHEIRTPLNAILGYHELLAREIDGPLTPAQRQHLARARASGQHLMSLISDVLDFSRLDAGQSSATPTTLRLGDAVSGALGLVEPQARARGIELSNAVSGRAGGLAAWGDEGGVRQVLANLLSNAIKFTETRQGEAGRITVSAGTATRPSPSANLSGPGPWVYVRVEDTGVGIPAERLEEMFEPFVQADMTLTRQAGGTGLGLAISRRLARLMHGDVTARSEIGVGSAFFLWLPASPTESLKTGGLEGHGPGSADRQQDECAAEDQPPGDPTPDVLSARPGRTLARVADLVLAELEHLLRAYVSRLRTDPRTPSAHAMDEAEIEDHLASFLADLASTFATIDVPEGSATDALRDSTAIQREVAARHGAQRARLGWSEDEIRGEFAILGEELARSMQEKATEHLPGPTGEARRNEAERELEVLRQFLAIAERVSIEGFRNARRGEGVPAHRAARRTKTSR